MPFIIIGSVILCRRLVFSMMEFLVLGSIGALAGLLAGLLGIGGGIVIVPVLIFLFEATRIAEYAPQLAIGTSLASIIFTGISSSRAHHRKGAVEWATVLSLAPFMIGGTQIGSFIAGLIDGQLLKRLFGIFEIFIAIRMWFPSLETKKLPAISRGAFYSVGGLFIGTLSALFGIGGGTLTVPLLVFFLRRPIRTAIGTSAATGAVMALFGTIGFIYQGQKVLPDMRWGFVIPEPAILIAVAASLTSRWGATIAHKIDPFLLSRIFSLLLIVVGIMLIAG